MAEFEQILLSNSGEDAFDAAIKLLSAKLFGEVQEHTTKKVSAFGIHSTPEDTHAAIQGLYRHAVMKWPLLGSGTDEFEITPPHLVRSIRPLLGWSLIGSDLSPLDATLEHLVSRDSKGSLGQYFTPREIVRMCVEVLRPTGEEFVIDPACGSGGFLFEALRHSELQTGKRPTCLGIDFSAKSIRVAALLAAATMGDSILISKANSLDGREYATSYPPSWETFLQQEAASDTLRARTWGAWNRLGCDVLLTNPPFAGDIDELALLDAYESQQGVRGKKVVSREHLFVERAVDLLKPGGRLAIVLPQGILANTTATYLRDWLLKRCRVLGVIGLHQNAFAPYTGVKTAIVFLTKLKKPVRSDYNVFFAVSHSAGKDSSGRQTGETDYERIVRSFSHFLHGEGFKWAKKSKVNDGCDPSFEVVSSREVIDTGRLDAEHYDPTTRRLQRRISEISHTTISSHVECKIPRLRRSVTRGEIAYVDISSVDQRTGLTFPECIPVETAPSRASYPVLRGDVLVSTVRPDRNVVAMITEGQAAPAVASNGFCVLRAKDIAPELLFAYCKTKAFREMLSLKATASMYPTVNDRDVLDVPFLRPPAEVEDEVVRRIRDGLEMIRRAQSEIVAAVELMNHAVSSATEEEGVV
jgi:type I restriction enzyme M protein